MPESFGAARCEHSVRTPAQFEQHARDVARLMGRRLLQTRVAFLAGSDLLRRPADDVIAYLEILSRVFSIVPKVKGTRPESQDDQTAPGGNPCVLDDFSARLAGAETLLDYHDRHLIHAGLGIESGDPEIRRRYGKTWDNDDLRRIVTDLEAAGFGVSLLTLVGAGGAGSRNCTLAGTARAGRILELARGDMVFLLDENELRDPAGSPTDVGFADRLAWNEQQDRMKQALAPLRERGVKVLPYSLEKQWA